MTGSVFICCCAPGAVSGQVRCRVWYLRDQMHHCGIHHEGLLGLLDVPDQERNPGVYRGTRPTHSYIDDDNTQPLVIASGLSVGKEGPSVHVACCIGNLIASMFKGFSRSQGMYRSPAALNYPDVALAQ